MANPLMAMTGKSPKFDPSARISRNKSNPPFAVALYLNRRTKAGIFACWLIYGFASVAARSFPGT
jgi:hypothetical protein